jgi:hypothetical protein
MYLDILKERMVFFTGWYVFFLFATSFIAAYPASFPAPYVRGEVAGS